MFIFVLKLIFYLMGKHYRYVLANAVRQERLIRGIQMEKDR